MMNTQLENITVGLKNEDQWRDLQPNHEMTINKTGRAIFPMLDFSVEGLEPEGWYAFGVSMERVDNMRYLYVNGDFTEKTDIDPLEERQPVEYQEGGFRKGADWVRYGVPFHNLKLGYNRTFAGAGCLAVICGRKYVPVLYVQRASNDQKISNIVHRRSFDFTHFFAVHRYNSRGFGELKLNMRRMEIPWRTQQAMWRCQMNIPPESDNAIDQQRNLLGVVPPHNPLTDPASISLFP